MHINIAKIFSVYKINLSDVADNTVDLSDVPQILSFVSYA